MKPTFQDNLYELFKAFWKAGYAYRESKEQNGHLFYSQMLEDLLNLPEEEFLTKYKFYNG